MEKYNYIALPGIRIAAAARHDGIIYAVASHTGVSYNKMQAKSRKKEIVFARKVAMYFIKSLTKTPLKEIGELFGNRDHTTVIYSVRSIEFQIKNYDDTKMAIEEIRHKILRHYVKN